MKPSSSISPAIGLFELLALRQLAPQAPGTPGALRPRLPYRFEDSPVVDAVVDFANREAADPPSPPAASPSPEIQEVPPASHSAAPQIEKHEPSPRRTGANDAAIVRTSAHMESAVQDPLPLSRAPLLESPQQPPRAATVSQPHANQPSVTHIRTLEQTHTNQPGVSHTHTLERIVPLRSDAQNPAGDRPTASVPPAARAVTAVPAPTASRPGFPPPLHDDRSRQSVGDTVIEIHIGRLEVRAPAAPVRSAPPPPVQDSHLASYLRGRANGARS
jgi:hypothetical protein